MGATGRAVGWVSLGWLLACGGLPLPTGVEPDASDGGEPAEAEPAEPEPAAPAEPEAAEPAEPEAAEPAEPAEPEPAGEPEPAAEPEPAPEPDPEPAEPRPAPGGGARGHVSVEGVDRVTLVAEDGDKYTVPADVPIGKYKMKARFGDGPPVEVGAVTVTEAGATIKCKPTMGLCRASSL